MDSDINALLNEYSLFMSQCVGKLTPAIHARGSIIEELIQDGENNLLTLDLLLGELRQYSMRTQSITDFISFKDELSKIVEEKLQSRDSAREAKQERQAAKTIVDDKLVELKRDIEQLVEANHKIEAQLQQGDDYQLPLMLKLMSSTKVQESVGNNEVMSK